MPVDEDAPSWKFPDEEAEQVGIGAYGWEQTNEEHGYCGYCGHRWEHLTEDCPHRGKRVTQ